MLDECTLLELLKASEFDPEYAVESVSRTPLVCEYVTRTAGKQ